MTRFLVFSVVVLLAAAGGAACKSARAATPVDRPNLEVPPPPPRLIEPPPPLDTPLEPVTDLPTTAPAFGGSRPKPQRDPVTTAKPEVKPEAPPETVPVAPPPPATPPQLRAPGLASPETAGAIRASLDRARSILDNTDYGKLKPPQRITYDNAKRFADEGDKELKAANYVLAKELAEKAERLAKELQGG